MNKVGVNINHIHTLSRSLQDEICVCNATVYVCEQQIHFTYMVVSFRSFWREIL